MDHGADGPTRGPLNGIGPVCAEIADESTICNG